MARTVADPCPVALHQRRLVSSDHYFQVAHALPGAWAEVRKGLEQEQRGGMRRELP
jgi:hypothetical protein